MDFSDSKFLKVIPNLDIALVWGGVNKFFLFKGVTKNFSLAAQAKEKIRLFSHFSWRKIVKFIFSKGQMDKILRHSISESRKFELSDHTNHSPRHFFYRVGIDSPVKPR